VTQLANEASALSSNRTSGYDEKRGETSDSASQIRPLFPQPK